MKLRNFLRILKKQNDKELQIENCIYTEKPCTGEVHSPAARFFLE